MLVPTTFLIEQTKYARVKNAQEEKSKKINEVLSKNGMDFNTLNILLIAYKDDDELELYAKNKTETVYKKIANFKICARSGQLGPKRKQGDNQVPEGFYTINRFNPASSYYLSLGLNYPNAADKLKSKANNFGGDIFIHGDCVTIGCMPMTNDKIKEIYLYAVYAKNNGQNNIPVYVFPFRMNEKNMERYQIFGTFTNETINFWKNLKTGYDMFFKDKKALNISVDKNGDYVFL
jgi:murein L,D-transpeptidase YafK